MQFKRLTLFAVFAALLTLERAASAVTLVFASFSFVGPATVSYDQSTGVLAGASVPIHFNYVNAGGSIVGTPSTGFGAQDALLSFTATRLGDVFSAPGIAAQELKLASFSIQRDTPLGGKSNLLSGSSSTSVLHGAPGGSVASLDGSMGAGSLISYHSDFLTFPPPTDADFSWALESIGPPLALAGNGNFRTFNASIAGTFGYNASPQSNVPEGSSVLLLAAGLLPLAMLVRQKVATAKT